MRGVILDEAVTDPFSVKVAFELRDVAGEGLNHEASGGGHFYVNPKLFKSKRVFFFFLSEKAVSGEGVPSTGQVGESRKTPGMSRGPRGRWPGGWAGGSRLSFVLSSTSISYRSSGFEKANEIR